MQRTHSNKEFLEYAERALYIIFSGFSFPWLYSLLLQKYWNGFSLQCTYTQRDWSFRYAKQMVNLNGVEIGC